MAEPRATDPFTASGELVALSGGDYGARGACFSCHGLDGMGNGAGAPRLAGLSRGYLFRQLDDYARGRRRHPEMEAIAGALDENSKQAVAAYYADMVPGPMGAAAAEGVPALYAQGDPERGLASCASCHGALGEGIGPANPPLAGQSSAYIAAQLYKWRSGERRNDPLNVMLEVSRQLTPAEIEALAAYASTLPGAPRHPEYREASLPERRDGPRNDASAPPPRAAGPAPAR